MFQTTRNVFNFHAPKNYFKFDITLLKQYLVTNTIETEPECKTSADPLGMGFAAKVKACNLGNESSSPLDFHRLFWLLLN